MDNAIIIKNVEKTFNFKKNIKINDQKNFSIKSVNDVSMNIKKGSMVGIIGKNGSGKTTLLRLISGIYSPDKGKISIVGKLGPLLQVGIGSNDEYSVKENIILYGLLLGLRKNNILKKIPEILKFAELEQYESIKMKYLSSKITI